MKWLLSAYILLMFVGSTAIASEPIPDKLVVLTFDDSSKSHFTVARPLLKKYKFGATFFVTEGFDIATNKRDYMTWDEIARLHEDGFEIGNHTRDHMGVTDKNVGELAEQVRAINQRCQAHGIPAPVSFAYPGNAIAKNALPILKDLGIKFARRGGSPEFPYKEGRGFAFEPGLDHPLLVPSAGDARPDWTLDDFKRAVAQAKDGKIAVLQFHGVPDTAHNWVTTSTEQFEGYLTYLADNKFQVIALRDLSRYVDDEIVPANPWGVIEDRQRQLAANRPAQESVVQDVQKIGLGAKLIWFDEGDPRQSVPAETRYFRRTFTEDLEVSGAKLHIACDDEFVLFVNGQEAGRSSVWQDGKVIDLKPLFRMGKNALAVQGTNRGGPAALVAWLEYDTASGNQKTLLTDAGWKCSKAAADKWNSIEFDDSKWAAARVIGEFGKIGPWPPVSWNGAKESSIPARGGKADPGRFRVKPGFTIDAIAEPQLTGSLVNMTLDCRGRPVISRENGPILVLDDPDLDGKYRKAKELTQKITNCQGLLAYDATTFYAVGNGPEGTGLYRLKDTKAADVYDEVRLIHKFKGEMSEHGPHAVIAGPDGYLYLCCGNMAGVTAAPEADSPVEKQYEGDLLPRYEDPSGHAAGIKVPGGTIWRLDPEGKHFTLEAAGFRNHFDIAFNSLGELFTFDSDMELQEFLPFYIPIRVCHCPPGAEFGWRSNSAKWPPYYVDGLPPTVDIGRGSPTGVIFYNHRQFPSEYQDAFLMGDWSQGRILSVKFRRDGATFKAETEEFVTGKPMNVVDIEVAPDGSVMFCTGGRGTEGGVYRIRSTRTAPKARNEPDFKGAAAAQAALDQPQPQSAWGREAIRRFQVEAGETWEPELEQAAKDRRASAGRRIRALSYLMQFGPEPSIVLARHLAADDDAEVRAQAAVVLARHPGKEAGADLVALVNDPAPIVQRRAAEGLVRTQTRAPLEKLRPALAGEDRFARFAARLALERTDPEQWREAILKDENPRVAIMGLIALNKLGVVASDAKVADSAFARVQSLLQADLPREDLQDTLRCLELILVNTQRESRPPSVAAIGEAVLTRFPTGDRPLDYELARVLAALRVSGGIDKMLDALEKHSQTEDLAIRADAIHYARCLVAVTEGWTPAQRRRYLAWFKISREWNGGFSYRSTIYYFLRDAAAQTPRTERRDWTAEMDKWPTNPLGPSGPIMDSKKAAAGWTYDQLLAFLEEDGRQGSVEGGRKIYEKANCAKCHRFEQISGGFGPDLTTLSSRFKRKDTLEAIIYPSRVIADQYKSWLVTTKSGKVIHGMKAPDEGDMLVLLLADASTLKLPKTDVEDIVESNQSTMPEALLDPFSPQEIADLFAFLESGKGAAPEASKPDN